MMCRSRLLTADGRVLACVSDHDTELVMPHFACADDWTLRWQTADPCAWEAPDCHDCEGEGGHYLAREKPNTFFSCDTCGGTGVDDTIPLALVGVGSVLRRSTSDESYRVFVVWIDGDTFDAVGTLDGDDMAAGYPAELCADIGPGKPWQVVRAVPPAHTGDTPCP